VIISHSRRFIFIKTYKTAGSSLEIALSRFCGKNDILTVLDPPEEALRRSRYGIGAQNYEQPLRAYGAGGLARRFLRGKRLELYREHDSAFQVREKIGEEIWNSYFKFACVRDPFDRCVSRYFYSRKYEWSHPKETRWDTESIDAFLRFNPDRINENWNLYTVCDEVIVDFLVRFEQMEADLAEVSRRIGLDGNLHDELAAIRAKGDLRPGGASQEVLLEERHRTLISILCEKEMQAAGYARKPRPAGVREVV
jgi:hypothetical protein